MTKKGMNMPAVKARNRSLILRDFLAKGSLSRKDLAEDTGLTQASVTQICSEFLEEGLLRETGEARSDAKVGRKKILLDLNSQYCFILAVTIETEWTKVTLSDWCGQRVAYRSRKTESNLEPIEFLRKIAGDGEQLLGKVPSSIRQRVAGVSVAISGQVDIRRGSSIRAYGLWEKEVPVCDFLSEQLHMPVMIENNVDSFALAETFFGSGRSYNNLLVIKWGPGVGASIVIGRELYEGHHQKAAEIGHFIVEKNGKKCSCGRRGCLETRVSYQALSQILPFEMEEFGEVYENLKRQEPQSVALQKWEEAMDLFARTIVNSVTVLAPSRVILYGKMFADEGVRARIIANCEAYAGKDFGSQVLYTTLADKEDYIGPVAVYLKRTFL